MATKRKKKEKKITYKVIQQFRSTVNDEYFACRKGEEVELTEFEHSILLAYVEEI